LADLVGLMALSVRPRRSLEAENLFLRRALALYPERGVKPRRVDAVPRVSLALLSRLFRADTDDTLAASRQARGSRRERGVEARGGLRVEPKRWMKATAPRRAEVPAPDPQMPTASASPSPSMKFRASSTCSGRIVCKVHPLD
jgi:hypothetical protein